jgi:hypothetical protein
MSPELSQTTAAKANPAVRQNRVDWRASRRMVAQESVARAAPISRTVEMVTPQGAADYAMR